MKNRSTMPRVLPCFCWRWVTVAIVAQVGLLTISSGHATGQTIQREETQTAKLQQQLRGINETILNAGRMFKKADYTQSAKLISEAQTAMADLIETADAETISAAGLTYRKLEKAHQMLTEKGQRLANLQPLKESAKVIPKQPEDLPVQAGSVSFVNQVAPVLLKKCGNCHVNDRRGNFSAASFQSLDYSAMITYGMADKSRLIEVIQSGEMPPTNPKVTQSELVMLKQWIDQGAKFDGKNPASNLTSLVRNVGADKSGEPAVALAKPSGKETVSFGLHIAPILLENCARCHIARNPQGNFSMASFAALMRGGNSGEKLLLPGQSANSEIVMRIKGEQRDVMPPGGKMDDKLIALIAKWIDEGARFDPADVRLPLRAVAAKGLATSMDHGRLTQFRKQAAQETWQLAFSGLLPTVASTENFLVIGTGSQGRLNAVGKAAENIARRVTKVLGATAKAPFVKGNTTLFVVDKRYDFSEFGRMVEKRAFDKSVVSSWQSDTVVARVVLLSGFNGRAADYEIPLARDLASVYVANLDASVPRWFADGVGYWTAAKMYGRDPMIQRWKTDAVAAANAMGKPDDFMSGNLGIDQTALVGYRFVEALYRNGRAMKILMNRLSQGVPFDSAFADGFGVSPEKMLQSQR